MNAIRFHSSQAATWNHLAYTRHATRALEIVLLTRGFFKHNVSGGDIRHKRHSRGVTKVTTGSRLPARHYAICILYTVEHKKFTLEALDLAPFSSV